MLSFVPFIFFSTSQFCVKISFFFFKRRNFISRTLQSRCMPSVSLFEATDRICILIDLYKNKIASFRRGQAVKEKGSALYFSTLLTRFISFAHPSWILTPFHRTIRRPITTVQMLRKRVYCEISNELSYRYSHLVRISHWTTNVLAVSSLGWVKKKKKIEQPSETDGLSVCIQIFLSMRG